MFTESPALQTGDAGTAPSIVAESSPSEPVVGLDDLLVDQLRDLLHAEKQLTKALPQMIEAARYDQLLRAVHGPLSRTEAQIERLDECFELLGKKPRARTCKGMQGIIEEGDEVIKEGARKMTPPRTSR